MEIINNSQQCFISCKPWSLALRFLKTKSLKVTSFSSLNSHRLETPCGREQHMHRRVRPLQLDWAFYEGSREFTKWKAHFRNLNRRGCPVIHSLFSSPKENGLELASSCWCRVGRFHWLVFKALWLQRFWQSAAFISCASHVFNKASKETAVSLILTSGLRPNAHSEL